MPLIIIAQVEDNELAAPMPVEPMAPTSELSAPPSPAPMGVQEPKSFVPKNDMFKRHDESMETLIKEYQEANKLGDRDKINELLSKACEFPYKGTTLLKWLSNMLKSILSSVRSNGTKPHPKAKNPSDQANPDTDAYHFIDEALKKLQPGSNIFAYLNTRASTYTAAPRKFGQERAELLLGPYYQQWDPNYVPPTGKGITYKKVPASKIEGKWTDWESFKKAAWEQYKKDNWKDSNGEPIDVSKAVEWYNSQILANRQLFPNINAVYPLNASKQMLDAIAKLSKNGVQVPESARNDVQQLNGLIATYNAKNPKNVKAQIEPIKEPTERSINSTNTSFVKKTLEKAGIPIPPEYDVTMEMLDPNRQVLGPNYFDKIKNMGGRGDVSYDAGEKSESIGDEAHMTKFQPKQTAQDVGVEHDLPSGEDDFSPAIHNMETPALPKYTPKKEAPLVAPKKINPALGIPNSVLHSIDPKNVEKAKERTWDLLDPELPEFRRTVKHIVDTTYDMTTEKLLHEYGTAVSNMKGGDKTEMEGQFLRDHEQELAAQFGSAVDGFKKIRAKVLKDILEYVSDPAKEQALISMNKTPAAAIAAIKAFIRLSSFIANTDLIVRRG